MKSLVWITGLAALLGLGCAPPAHADEYGFIYAIRGAGLNVMGDLKMLRLGDAVCADFTDGATVYDIAAALTEPGAPFTLYQAAEIIYASVDQLCPEYKARAIAEVGGTGSLV